MNTQALVRERVRLNFEDWLYFYDVNPEMIPYSEKSIVQDIPASPRYIWTQVHTPRHGLAIFQGVIPKVPGGQIMGWYIAGLACDKGECDNIMVTSIKVV